MITNLLSEIVALQAPNKYLSLEGFCVIGEAFKEDNLLIVKSIKSLKQTETTFTAFKNLKIYKLHLEN